MHKRVALAFLLSLVVIIGYNYFLTKKYPSLAPQAESRLDKEPASPTPLLPLPQLSNQPQLSKLTSAGKDIIVETDLAKLVITSSGARIKSYKLKQYAEEKIDSATVQKQIAQLEQAIAGAQGPRKDVLLYQQEQLQRLLEHLKQDGQMAELISLAAAREADFSPSIVFPEQQQMTLELNTGLYQVNTNALVLNSSHPEGQLEFTYLDRRGRGLKKIYHFNNSSYVIGLKIVFFGWESPPSTDADFILFCGPDIGLPQVQQGRRSSAYQGALTYFRNPTQSWLVREKYTAQENGQFVMRQHSGAIVWTGLTNKYFLAALIPQRPVESVVVEKDRFGAQKVGLKVPWPPEGAVNLRLYLGPKKEDQLKQVGATLEKTIDYGLFSPIARLIYQILVFFSRWTKNFGWAIVMLCVIIKIVFYPLTHHSVEAMQKMQQEMKTMQPEMTALREKYKDSPQKLNKAVMELYRKKGINPLSSCQSGCLPLVLQMPVFFALYAVLYNSIELRGAPFWGWISDLSAKDPYYLLPILMGISMFIQQKLTGMTAASGAQQDQARMMAIMMPIVLTWVFASLPSGVVLYWLAFNILSALEQWMAKRKRQTLALS